jgi:hypothetical protein
MCGSKNWKSAPGGKQRASLASLQADDKCGWSYAAAGGATTSTRPVSMS